MSDVAQTTARVEPQSTKSKEYFEGLSWQIESLGSDIHDLETELSDLETGIEEAVADGANVKIRDAVHDQLDGIRDELFTLKRDLGNTLGEIEVAIDAVDDALENFEQPLIWS